MEWVSFSTVSWQDLQNLLSLSKGCFKRLFLSLLQGSVRVLNYQWIVYLFMMSILCCKFVNLTSCSAFVFTKYKEITCAFGNPFQASNYEIYFVVE